MNARSPDRRGREAGPWRALAALAMLALAGCGGVRPADAPRTGGAIVETRFQMGTLVRVAVVGGAPGAVRQALAEAFARIDAVVSVMSEWEPDSDISRVNAAAGGAPVSVDPTLVHVLEVAERVAVASEGAFDVTWAPLRHVWCFDAGCAPPDDEVLTAAVSHVDHAQVVIDRSASTVRLADPGMEIGLGGIAKGFAIASAAEALRAAGLRDFVIDAGGDVYAAGSNGGSPWRVAVADPRGGPPIQGVELRDRALVTSGDYERYFELGGRRYHHILDPRTGMPAEGLVQVTVMADDPTVADALATAAFVLGPARGLALLEAWPRAEGLLVDGGLARRATSGWPDAD